MCLYVCVHASLLGWYILPIFIVNYDKTKLAEIKELYRRNKIF